MSEQLFENPEALAGYAARRVAELCSDAVAINGVCHLVLAGGSTPKRCYELLRDMDLPWASLHIWFGDERCLPVGDAERNDTMADAALLSHVPVPPEQVYRMPAELGPELAAQAYVKLLAAAPVMDIVLLGMGEDGHTASLFPDNPALQDKRLAVPVYDSPKPPPERVSMGYGLLNNARHRILMVAGKGKAEALARIRAGEPLPIAAIADGEWLIDRDAMGVAA
ncbi:MAG: 6-phosphogluconolactonase [Zetaproteobacteria bacterium CG12_big_fil_rev_8_21_14_0_65_54_13]|nr:MAG: 6-phosphogluconolactonase [Zetaproteobacteria bacterium CG12_big_fil_rev_8_21_14_0_65_54_13]PIX55666.1 MAG: 6-phosphogluconolactonase [Zetaproteobacteria bacterium CG_4_10_14_3_um_filter_54_28]PJA30278.1 MAG: 6-phosphogluconolactonase [Zetaproteobacteria bacterium CG_4_9_14_3_um_filter_54_145]